MKHYLYRIYRTLSGFAFRARRRFTRAGFLVLSALVVVAGLGADTVFSMTYQAFVLLAGILVVSLGMSFVARGNYEVQRIVPRHGTVGEPMPYRIRLKNRTRKVQRGLAVLEAVADPRPSYEQFRETPEPGETKRNAFDRMFGFYRWRWLLEREQRARIEPLVVPDVAPGDVVQVEHRMMPTRRGVLRLEGMAVAWADPFGLCRALFSVKAPQQVVILPRRYPLPRLPLPGTQQYQPGGVALARAVGESEEMIGVRDYRPGDPLRHIHWRSWARTGHPIVREFQDEYFVRHGLVLDTYSPDGEDAVFEEAVSLAASFACTVEEEDSLLDLLFVGAEAYVFTAGRGLAHPQQMLEILAGVPACRDAPFERLENLVLEHAGSVTGCICIFLKWDEDRARLVSGLEARGIPMAVFLVVPRGAGGGKNEGVVPESVHVIEVGCAAEQLAAI